MSIDRDLLKTKRLPRDELAEFLPSHRAIKAFENVANDILDTLPDAIDNSVTDETAVLSMQAFLQRPPMPHTPINHADAEPILAAQIFGA